MFPDLNIVDYVILGVLILFTLESLGRSLVLEILDFISFLLAFFLSFSLYNFPAKFFESQFAIPHGLSLVMGFMTTWFLSETIFFLSIKFMQLKMPKLQIKGEKFLSLIPSFLRGIIFVSLILVLVGTFPIQPVVKKTIQNSTIGSLLQRYAYQLEQPVKSVFGGVANDSLAFLTIKPKTDQRINLGFKTNDFKTADNEESQMIDLVNKERESRGIKKLEFDISLRSIARGYSADMLVRGYFSHYSPENKTVADRVSEGGIDFLVVGENLAYAPSLDSAFKGLMNSEGHRANILSTDYHKIGIGVMDAGVYGEMFTQVFTN